MKPISKTSRELKSVVFDEIGFGCMMILRNTESFKDDGPGVCVPFVRQSTPHIVTWNNANSRESKEADRKIDAPTGQDEEMYARLPYVC